MDKKYIVAFEIGSSNIKGAIATTEPGNSGRVNILAVATEHLVDKVRYGCVENPGDVATCVSNICRKLQANVAVAPRVIKEVFVGLSGRSLMAVPHEIARDFHTEVEVTRAIIDELMQQASKRTVPDREVVAVEPGTFTLDNITSNDPIGNLGHVLTANVNLVVCKPKMRNNLRRVFYERCGLNLAGYEVTPLSMGSQLLTVEERRLGVMMVDFGAETTTVSIYREGVLVYLATIPMGSRNITRDITTLNCLEERAEEIKKAVGNAMPPETEGQSMVIDGLDNSKINNIVSARADEIISNIFEQINYAGLKPEQLPAGIVVAGGGSRLNGFNDLLAKQTRMKVRPAALGAGVNIVGNDFNVNDALDVISIIATAALYNPVECTELPPYAQIEQEQRPAIEPGKETHTDAIDPEGNVSRIGLDNDADDNWNQDDPDPDEEQDVDKGKGKNKKEDKKKEKKEDESGSKGERNNNSFLQRLSNRLNDLLTADKEFEQ